MIEKKMGLVIRTAFNPKFLRYQESNLVIPKLFLRKQAFIYMATTLGVGKPFSGMESFPLTDQTWNPSNRN